jgi:transcriptional regulator with XRE-family HTH domain
MPRPPTPTNAVDKFIGARLRMRRKMLGKTQTDLAQALGLTFQQIQKYENGKNRISSSRMFQISDVLGVPPEFFYEGAARIDPLPAGNPKPGFDHASVQEFFSTKDGLDLARAFLSIERLGVRRKIVALVSELAEQGTHAGDD